MSRPSGVAVVDNILATIKDARRICVNVSLLLRTVDEIMAKRNWASLSTQAYYESSAALLNPEKWIPFEVYRFYSNNESQTLLPFVSVLLDDDREGRYTLVQPVVTAGVFGYAVEKGVGESWDYWYARWYGYMKDRVDNGEVISLEAGSGWKEKMSLELQPKIYFESSKCFGLPLESFKNPSDVEHSLAEPLLDLLDSEKKRAPL